MRSCRILFAVYIFLANTAATIAGGSRNPLEKPETILFSHIAIIADYPEIPRFVFSDDIHLTHRDLSEKLAQRIGSHAESISGAFRPASLKQGFSPPETALTLLVINGTFNKTYTNSF